MTALDDLKTATATTAEQLNSARNALGNALYVVEDARQLASVVIGADGIAGALGSCEQSLRTFTGQVATARRKVDNSGSELQHMRVRDEKDAALAALRASGNSLESAYGAVADTLNGLKDAQKVASGTLAGYRGDSDCELVIAAFAAAVAAVTDAQGTLAEVLGLNEDTVVLTNQVGRGRGRR